MELEKKLEVGIVLGRWSRAKDALTHAQTQVRTAQETIRFHTPVVVQFEAELARLSAEIRKLGFHDAGHALGELMKATDEASNG